VTRAIRRRVETMEYISSESQRAMSAKFERTRLVVWLLAASVLLVMALAWVIPARPADAAESWARNFYFVAIAMGLGVVAVRRVLLASFRLKMAKRQGVEAILNIYSLTSIICGALGESVGLLGLVAYLVTGDRQFSWRLGAVGLLIIAFSFPRRYEWRAAAREAEQGAASGRQG
jgi:hypothetical protein